LARADPHARRYNPAVAPFAALAALDAASFDALLMLVGPATLVALFTVDEVSFPDGFVVAKRALADQMLLENPAACELTDLDPLGLVTCQRCWSSPTRPNPVLWLETVEFGGYLGIRRKGRLIAMAGQRMKIPASPKLAPCAFTPIFGVKDWRPHSSVPYR
jgi:hypothetical protein